MKKLLAILGIVIFTGCASLAPGEDPVVVRSEQAIELSIATFEAYMDYGETNYPAMSESERSAYRYFLENRGGVVWVDSLERVLEDYKLGIASESEVNAALSALRGALAEAAKYVRDHEVKQ